MEQARGAAGAGGMLAAAHVQWRHFAARLLMARCRNGTGACLGKDMASAWWRGGERRRLLSGSHQDRRATCAKGGGVRTMRWGFTCSATWRRLCSGWALGPASCVEVGKLPSLPAYDIGV